MDKEDEVCSPQILLHLVVLNYHHPHRKEFLHLENKNAIITGGLGGYGLAIASLILKRGGRVLLADIVPEIEANETLKSRFAEALEAKTLMYTVCDVTSEAQIEAAFEVANAKLTLPDTTVDILINGAGIVGEQNWKKMFEINIVSSTYFKSYIGFER